MFKNGNDNKSILRTAGRSRKIAIVLSLFCICLISVFFIACGRAKDVTNTAEQGEQADAPVSYTHLTLPTSDLG